MGGLTGILGLEEMERNNEDTETEKFIALDAPLRGANVPLGVQALLTHIHDFKVFGLIPLPNVIGEIGENIKNSMIQLSAQAAREMLYYYQDGQAGDKNMEDFMGDHTAFYTYFRPKQEALQVPITSISNGSINRIGQTYNAGDILTDRTLRTFVNVLARAVPDATAANDFEVYNGEIYNPTYLLTYSPIFPIFLKRLGLLGGLGTIFENTYERLEVSGLVRPYDSAPGGQRILNNEDEIGENFDHDNHCFVPTISALALNIDDPDHPNHDLEDKVTILSELGLTTIRNYVGPTAPNPEVPGDMNANQNHGFEVSQESRDFILLGALGAEGTGLSGLANGILANRTYNFGANTDNILNEALLSSPIRRTTTLIDHDLNISTNGRMWINQNDRVDFTDVSAHPFRTPGNTFDVCITAGCEVSPTVVVENNGEIHIGAGGSNPDTLTATDGTSLIMESGSFVYLEEDSKLVIQAGAHFHIKTGAQLRLEKGAQVIIEPGGLLTTEPECTIDLWYDNTNIFIQGEWNYEGAFEFDGSGYFQFDPGHTLSLEATFKLTGQSKAQRFIQINNGAEVTIENFGIGLKTGLIQYGTGAALVVKENQKGKFDFVTFQGNGGNGVGYQGQQAGQANFTGCAFSDLEKGVCMQEMTEPVQIWYSTFNSCLSAAEAESSTSISVNSSTFEGTGGNAQGVTAFLLDDVQDVYLSGCTVQDFSLAGFWMEYVEALRLYNSTVDNNQMGMHSPTNTFSNIFLYENSVIQNHTIAGIDLESGGLVLMDCAKLINNEVGITG